MYKYETHMHTCEVSKCANVSGKEYAKIFKEMGYDGIFITDHFYHGNNCLSKDLSWEEFIDEYCKGYELVKQEGDKIGLKVFFGIEETFLDEKVDYLVYGLDKQKLKSMPELKDANREEFVHIIRKAGGIIVHAHPFRDARYVDVVNLHPDEPDAIEIINTHQNPICNRLAIDYAKKYNFMVTVGSDVHKLENIDEGLASISYEKPLNCVEDYIFNLRNKIMPKIEYTTIREDVPFKENIPIYLHENGIVKEIRKELIKE